MSLFPFLDNEKEAKAQQEQQEDILCEYEYDFVKNRFTGRKLYGLEALKQWIIKTIRTTRYKHIIYTWDHGVGIEDIINKPYNRNLIESEVSREIEEALSIHNKIKGITNFRSTFKGSTLYCEFDVLTEMGNIKINEKYAKL